MARPPHPKPPSAIAGYQRLARTRSVVSEAQVQLEVGTVDAAPRPRRRAPRLAGALRLAGFVSVLAIIVGTSVGLASADTRGAEQTAQPRTTTVTKVAQDAEPTEKVPAASEAARPVDDTTPAARAGADGAAGAVVPVAAAGTAAGELPLTGERAIEHVLLGGALLVLLGMLVQVAGQPLPARATR